MKLFLEYFQMWWVQITKSLDLWLGGGEGYGNFQLGNNKLCNLIITSLNAHMYNRALV